MHILEQPVVGPAELLQAMQAQRQELRDQLEQLEEKREELQEQIRENRNQGLDISGLEGRVKETDLRISAVDQQLALADAAVAKAAAVPGAIVPEPPRDFEDHGPPDGAFVVGGLFVVFVMMPVALAFARRLWKRGTSAVAAIPADLAERLRGIEQAIESMALEVERIGEGQRFMTRVLTEQREHQQIPVGTGDAARR
jgi:DNA repair exonuclease SbcCD ATPase subunit